MPNPRLMLIPPPLTTVDTMDIPDTTDTATDMVLDTGDTMAVTLMPTVVTSVKLLFPIKWL